MSVVIETTPGRKLAVDEPIFAAERIRRANACSEMADVLRTLGNGSTVPDIKWMADVAVEELTSRAKQLNSQG